MSVCFKITHELLFNTIMLDCEIVMCMFTKNVHCVFFSF